MMSMDWKIMKLSSRIRNIGASVTLEIDSKAKQMRSQGIRVISFGTGEPDFPTPKYIADAASRAALDPQNHKYTATQGLPELRKAIARKTLRDSGYPADPADIVVTNGGKQAVYEAIQIVADPGDEVIIPSPYWVSYTEAVKLAGGVPVCVPAAADTDFEPAVEQLERARTPATKAIIVNSPNNPTGSVWSEQVLRDIARWALENGIWVLSDEIYEHLVYDGAEAPHIGALEPDIRRQLIVVNGVAKTYAMTGWRVGWLIAPPDAAAAAARLQGHMTSNVNNVAQRAAIEAVSGDLSAVAEMRDAFDVRRHAIVAALNRIPGISCGLPRGAFYVFADIRGLLGRPLGSRKKVYTDSVQLASDLLEDIHIAVIPGEGFGMPGHIRFSYALSDDDLAEGMLRLEKWVMS